MNNDEDVGKLGFPHVRLREFSHADDFATRCFLQYSLLIDTTEIGAEILEFIQKDDRCQSLTGHLLSSGSGGCLYEPANLAKWFLWRANKVGEIQARKELETYLDNDTVDVICTLWVLGLELPHAVDIGEGIRLLPAKDMPESTDKEAFLQYETDIHARRIKPLAALTKLCRVKKLLPVSEDRLENFIDVDFQRAMEQLHHLATLINSLPGACCVPHYSTSYLAEHVPVGPFGGAGGGAPIFDVVTFAKTDFPVEFSGDLLSLLRRYSGYPKNEQNRLARILMRISQAKRRMQIEDKILDFGIAMEMLLLDDNEKEQLSLSFRLRGAWLLALTKGERREKYDLFKKMYALRSSVAHTGTIFGGAQQKVQAAIELMPRFQALAEDVARKIILDGSPDWDEIVLNLSD